MLKNKAHKRHEREWLVVFSLFHGRRTSERETGANQRSGRVRAKVSQANKTNPHPDLEAQGAAIKNPSPAGKTVGDQEKETRQLGKARGRREEKPPPAGKSQGAAKKPPPRLSLARAAQGQGKRARAKPAKRTQTRADTKTEGGLRQPKTRAEKHTPKKEVLGLSQDRRRPPPAKN